MNPGHLFKRLLGKEEPALPCAVLGRTGLRISRMGFGLGGIRRGGFARKEALGLSQIREAWRLGIRYFDTAAGYGNEKGLPAALGGRLNQVLVSSKLPALKDLGTRSLEEHLCRSLEVLRRESLDICFLHMPLPEEYEEVRGRHLPALVRLKEKGLVKAIGLTESFTRDPGHAMLAKALEDTGAWDVFMVGCNFINSSACSRVFPEAGRQGIGLVGMFAVRNVFSQPELFRKTLDGFAAEGRILLQDRRHPLLQKLENLSAPRLADYAYRYALSQPALHSVLMGTSSPGHLAQNIGSLQAPPLPADEIRELQRIFSACDFFSGH